MIDSDLDPWHRSLKRVAENEAHRAKATGFATNKQGQAIIRQYRELLAAGIAADRKNGRRDYVVWRALKGADDPTLAFRLLTAGVTVCANDELGVDDDDQKNYRDIALCIGRCLNQKKGELALKVGGWGAKMLVTSLPTLFAFDDDQVLTLLLPDDLDDFLNGVVECAAKGSPYLLPFATPPEPWTQYWRGGLTADCSWARHKIEAAVCDAVSKGRMEDVLGAVNSLQAVPFTINKAVLDFIRREPGEPIPDAPDPSLPRGQS
jgi:hypothetical protein